MSAVVIDLLEAMRTRLPSSAYAIEVEYVTDAQLEAMGVPRAPVVQLAQARADRHRRLSDG